MRRATIKDASSVEVWKRDEMHSCKGQHKTWPEKAFRDRTFIFLFFLSFIIEMFSQTLYPSTFLSVYSFILCYTVNLIKNRFKYISTSDI